MDLHCSLVVDGSCFVFGQDGWVLQAVAAQRAINGNHDITTMLSQARRTILLRHQHHHRLPRRGLLSCLDCMISGLVLTIQGVGRKPRCKITTSALKCAHPSLRDFKANHKLDRPSAQELSTCGFGKSLSTWRHGVDVDDVILLELVTVKMAHKRRGASHAPVGSAFSDIPHILEDTRALLIEKS